MNPSKPLQVVLSTALSCLHESDDITMYPSAYVLTEDQRDRLRQVSGVRMSKKLSFASILAITAAKLCCAHTSVSPDRLGVIASGGPTHLQVAFDLTRAIISEGSEFLDPLRFPHSIPSAVPTSVAAACNAKAFAFGLGDGHEAFFEGIEQAGRLIAANYADSVLVVAANDSGDLVQAAVRATRRKDAVDAGICALVTGQNVECPSLELIQCARVAVLESHVKPLQSGCDSDEYGMGNNIDACAATGAIVMLRAAMDASKSVESPQPFRVGLRSKSRKYEVVLRWRHG